MYPRSEKRLATGLLYLLLGAGTSLLASGYPMGTSARIGPGYFPFWLGLLLAALGLSITVRAYAAGAPKEKLERWDLRSLSWMTGSVVLFGVMLKPLGLVLAIATLVVVASRASHEFTWRGALANAAVMVVLIVGAFVHGLGLPFNLWPAFLD
ncbi:tripartite tricarboxylate transporter TctB family protein [Pigmentiphaga sp. H8]|uniref:tripartite tricarboxylate transporter TctB family protein n=1 Tax=unclassified Pigmentiphaga TaxID=2626614 RepID=UPI000F5AD0D5|nr:tripartite tricarboxylate transporter TctB family protein [Pigmentiphaga sp. H8]AZG09519.1 tripartite tricarboxylate transporter TctB family protein [Pigmentiphaga sp. H8]